MSPDREERTVAETPPARRRLLGAALRRHRESLGYRLDDAARILECDRSKISRIESGQRGIRARDLRDLLTNYGVSEPEQRTLAAIAHPHRASGWWQPYTGVLPGTWLDYLITEAAASQIQAYQPQQVPDLLQTREYARAVAAADPALSVGTQDLVLEALLTRQQLILGERRSELAVVIGEGALHQAVGGTKVMRAQLAHLAEMSGTHPQITIQVLPFAGGAHPVGGSGPLSILRFADAPSLGVVHLPGPCGGIILDSPPDVASHARAFTLLRASALTPAATTQLLQDGRTLTGARLRPPLGRRPSSARLYRLAPTDDNRCHACQDGCP
jgi:transcriptional regulator with XRE-family HTH domain